LGFLVTLFLASFIFLLTPVVGQLPSFLDFQERGL
jgi:hypothetical protein